MNDSKLSILAQECIKFKQRDLWPDSGEKFEEMHDAVMIFLNTYFLEKKVMTKEIVENALWVIVQSETIIKGC